MIDLFYYMSPNVQKVLILLEETGLAYRLKVTDVTKGEQYGAAFAAVSPNNRLPAITDHAPAAGVGPLHLFESGAILHYLAEKAGRFLSPDPVARARTLQWLFWQVGGLGAIGGQRVHFRNYAPRAMAYPIARFDAEHARLLGVLDRVLAERKYLVGEYSIADMACAPWLYAHDRRGQLDLDGLPHVARWYAAVRGRPAFGRAYEIMGEVAGGPVTRDRSTLDDAARRILFGGHAVDPPGERSGSSLPTATPLA